MNNIQIAFFTLFYLSASKTICKLALAKEPL
jgi:hypothetical protein